MHFEFRVQYIDHSLVLVVFHACCRVGIWISLVETFTSCGVDFSLSPAEW